MSDEKQRDATVTISRVNGDREAGGPVRIEIRDEASGAAVSVRMTLEDFAQALLGMAHMDARIDRAVRLDKWGRQIECKTVSVSSSGTPQDRRAWCADQAARHCPVGFESTGGSFTNRGTYEMSFARWLDAEKATQG